MSSQFEGLARPGVVMPTYMFVTVMCLGNIACGRINQVGFFYGQGTLCFSKTHWDQKCIQKGRTDSSAVNDLPAVASECLADSNCIGVSVRDANTFYKHYQCPVETTECNVDESQTHKYFSKMCDHGGKWRPEEQSCSCVDGWVGPSCRTYPTDCLDLSKAGYKSGEHAVLLDADGTGLNTISTNCFIIGNYHHIGLVTSFGTRNSNKTWIDYRNGFRDDPIWSGLEEWHQLSSQGFHTMDLKINVKGVGIMYRTYKKFVVGDESRNFAYTFDSSTDMTDNRGAELKDAGCSMADCFGGYQNVPFSTWDRDMDNDDDKNCALDFGEGWWFSQGCNLTCNLFGSRSAVWDSSENATHALPIVGPGTCMSQLYNKDIVIDILLRKVD